MNAEKHSLAFYCSEISELQRTEKRGTGEDKRDKKSLRIFDELLISFNCHYEKIEDVLR